MKKHRKEVTKIELESYPLSKYEGEILLVETAEEAERVAPYILQEEVIGIDTETKPSFKKGLVHQVSLVQIATRRCVYLFRINKTGFTDGLLQILRSEQLIKVGIAIRDDIKDLQKLRYFKPASFVDLNITAVDLGYESIGAKKLSALVLGFRISKKQQTSNWEKDVLTEQQISYAATDAWICLSIYDKFNELYADFKSILKKRL